MLEELLKKYDLYHSSIISGGKVKFNINYILDGKIYVSLNAIIGEEERKDSFDFKNDNEFKNFVLPKIIQRFVSKNVGVSFRKIMGDKDHGTVIIGKKDLKDSLIIRNCSLEVIDLVSKLLDSLDEVSNMSAMKDSRIIFDSASSDKYDTYIRNNILFDYATYRTMFFKIIGMANNSEDEESSQLLVLNIARFACTFDHNLEQNVWDEIKKSYGDNEKVINVCNEFKNLKFDKEDLYTAALNLAEFEKNNDLFLHANEIAVNEALEACDNVVNLFNNSYLAYWDSKQKYYASVLDSQRQAICLDFMQAHDLGKNDAVGIKNKIELRFTKPKSNGELINKFKNIKKQKLSFSDIINGNGEEISEPKEVSIEDEVDKIFFDLDREEVKKGAEEQAKDIIKVEQERDQLKKDAEEFAKIIIEAQKENKKILEAAEEQAKRIIELEKENEELKRLAQDNARYLFEEERLSSHEEKNKASKEDLEKINKLLEDLAVIKEMDFAINRPTVMQEISFLEDRINSYLSGHSTNNEIVHMEKGNDMEKKPVESLLSLLKTTYESNHIYEKEGKNSLIEFSPVDEDTYRVSMYLVKDTMKDMIMDGYFEEKQLTDEVLKEICDIFSKDAVIVASKMNIRSVEREDYVVIDLKNNTLRFNNFRNDLIDRIREYI